MPRPSKPKRVSGLPRCCEFSGEICKNQAHHIVVSVEEFETVRLIDYLGMTQEECASSMNVSRITVQTLYAEARKKLARFLVEGSRLQIQGGNFFLDQAGERPAVNDKSAEKGDYQMIIAVTYENGEVFQHFGHTEAFKLYQVENNQVVSSKVVDTNGSGHGALAGFLSEHQVDVLICGGIGGGARNALVEAGIQLFGGACGNADAQVESYLAGNLSYNPNVQCNHHHDHGEGGCGSHGGGCGSHHGEGHECRHGNC